MKSLNIVLSLFEGQEFVLLLKDIRDTKDPRDIKDSGYLFCKSVKLL